MENTDSRRYEMIISRIMITQNTQNTHRHTHKLYTRGEQGGSELLNGARIHKQTLPPLHTKQREKMIITRVFAIVCVTKGELP